jgi:hypothetical protein
MNPKKAIIWEKPKDAMLEVKNLLMSLCLLISPDISSGKLPPAVKILE